VKKNGKYQGGGWGQGSVRPYRRNGVVVPGKWRVQLYDPAIGGAVSRVVTAKTETEARSLVARQVVPDIRGAQDRLAAGKPFTLTFTALADEWLTRRTADGGSAKAVMEEQKKLNSRILPAFGSMQVSAITVRDLEAAYYHWAEKVSVTTVRHHHSVINAILNFGERQYPGKVTNPARLVRQLRPVEREKTVPDDKALMAIVLEAEKVDKTARGGIRSHRLMVYLAGATGGRRGELAALRWSDIDFEAGVIHISRSVGQSLDGEAEKGTKTPKSKRIVPIVNGLEDDLLAQRKRQGPGAVYVIGDGDGKEHLRLNRMTDRFRALATRTGYPKVRLHDMRHFYATMLLRSGMDVVQVAELMGHSNPYMTLKTYAHALPNAQVAGAVEAAMPNLGPVIDFDDPTTYELKA